MVDEFLIDDNNNMQEIKIRAWHAKSKLWYHWIPIHGQYHFVNHNADHFNLCDWGNEDLVKILWTGLKDKHGKDIYKGDIVNIGSDLRVIEWHVIGLRCKSIKHDWNFALHYPFVSGEQTDWEIVGSIYENPELLNSCGK